MSEDRPRDLSMIEVVRLQQAACERAGSHLYAQILDEIARDVEDDGPCGAILAPWSANALADAVPLRLLAAIHRIVLDGRAPALAEFFPSAGGESVGDPVPAFRQLVAEHRGELVTGMHEGVQTNEVGRACSLVGGFHLAWADRRLPLRLLEVGASAGLLLRWDHYEYVAGDLRWGRDEGLRFEEPWVGDPPPLHDDLVVAERTGCDIHPIDPTTAEGVTRLRGFLWPDQRHRRARLDAAIEIADRVPATVEQADAGAWAEAQLASPTPGKTTVIYHSIVLQYLPKATFRRLRRAIESAGERATPDAPLYWLRMEPAGMVADVRMRCWPRGHDRLLGTTEYHGPPVDWAL